MKKYLKTIKDIEALRNTDTKIYRDNHRSYYKFVNCLPCLFWETSDVYYNATIDFNQVKSELYIEVEDEPSEDDIGKLGWFWDGKYDAPMVDLLEESLTRGKYKFRGETGNAYKHFRPLTPEEVEKYTGYKVAKED